MEHFTGIHDFQQIWPIRVDADQKAKAECLIKAAVRAREPEQYQ